MQTDEDTFLPLFFKKNPKNAFFWVFLKKSGKKIKNRKIEDDQLLNTDNTLLLRYHSKKSVEKPRRSIKLKKKF